MKLPSNKLRLWHQSLLEYLLAIKRLYRTPILDSDCNTILKTPPNVSPKLHDHVADENIHADELISE